MTLPRQGDSRCPEKLAADAEVEDQTTAAFARQQEAAKTAAAARKTAARSRKATAKKSTAKRAPTERTPAKRTSGGVRRVAARRASS